MALTSRLARSIAAALDAGLRRLPLAGSPEAAFEVGVAVARLLRWVDRRSDERIDVSRAGRALLTAEPRAVARLAARLPGGTVVISGTNGKTTTTNLLADLLTAAGHRPVVNRVGANMAGGVAAELVAAARFPGRVDGDIGVFEVDELWLERVLPDLAPRVVVLTNLFRDQLDRMGEVDLVADGWEALFPGAADEPVLVVNADDPRLAQLGGSDGRVIRFGVESTSAELPAAADLPDCRRCSAPLAIGATHIGHLGAWRCETCGAGREVPDVEAQDVRAANLAGASFILVQRAEGGERRTAVQLPMPGRFNVANAAAAVAATAALGVPTGHAVATIERSSGAFGRAERLEVDGRPLTVLLAKNPVGADEIVALLASRPALDLLVLLNDRDIDGRDVSWIWDADVEAIADVVATVTCGGSRGADAAMRFDYAGVPGPAIELAGPVSAALVRALERASDELLVVANYTAVLEVRELVAEQGHAERYWA